ncbi:MAG: hypothetical protein HY812_10055 [Planctomycetes bacterium]|nr:hypothetical protein [Planctomycetota bacterium]
MFGLTGGSVAVGRGLLVCVVLALPSARGSEDAPRERVLFDFEAEEWRAPWSARGGIEIARLPLPESEEPPDAALDRFAARICAGAGSACGARLPGSEDWSKLEELSFRVFRAPEEASLRPGVTLEVRLVEADGRARFWRKVVLEHAGWRRVALPLRWFRWGPERVPRWDRIGRIDLYFRGEAEVWIDRVALLDEESGPGTAIPREEIGSLAFPCAPAEPVRAAAGAGFEILTDCSVLDLPRLVQHLESVREALRQELPFLPEPLCSPRLLVFATREEYQAFPPRIAARFNSEAARPETDGYTVFGLATGWWKEERGTLRPTYTHEFVHALLEQSLLLQNKSEWLHEGVAAHFQLRFHPQADIAATVQDGIARDGWSLPLERLLDGEPIPANRYWQAMTVVEMLLSTPRHREKLAELLASFQAAGSTALAPHLEPVLGVAWEEFTADWLAYCRQAYPLEEG